MIKTLGLILKKQNLGETDRIITVLTPAFGKRRVVAKAVRRPLSKLAGHLDSLMITQLMITDKKELPQVTSAELVEPFVNIRESLELLEQAYAVGKVAERLAQENTPQQSLFHNTVDAFSRIDEDINCLATWLHYLYSLSKLYGVYISEFNCHDCNKEIIGEAQFSFEDRLLYHPEHAPAIKTRRLKGNSLKLLRLLHKKPYEMIAKINIPQAEAAEVEEVLLVELIENYSNASWRQYARLARD